MRTGGGLDATQDICVLWKSGCGQSLVKSNTMVSMTSTRLSLIFDVIALLSIQHIDLHGSDAFDLDVDISR